MDAILYPTDFLGVRLENSLSARRILHDHSSARFNFNLTSISTSHSFMSIEEYEDILSFKSFIFESQGFKDVIRDLDASLFYTH